MFLEVKAKVGLKRKKNSNSLRDRISSRGRATTGLFVLAYVAAVVAAVVASAVAVVVAVAAAVVV